jgi:trehalose 6-phosphate synthase
MDCETRAENHRKLFKYVNKYSASFWGSTFIGEMSRLAAVKDAGSEERAKPSERDGGAVLQGI